jgi:hypothetical protein
MRLPCLTSITSTVLFARAAWNRFDPLMCEARYLTFCTALLNASNVPAHRFVRAGVSLPD